MTQQCPKPFRPEDCQVLNQIAQSIQQTLELLRKCERCGLSQPDLVAENERQLALIEGLKREFFTLQP